MPAIKTFARPVDDRVTVSVPREYRSCSSNPVKALALQFGLGNGPPRQRKHPNAAADTERGRELSVYVHKMSTNGHG